MAAKFEVTGSGCPGPERSKGCLSFAAQGLRTNEIAVTLVNMTGFLASTWASYRGGELADLPRGSVVKPSTSVAAHRWDGGRKIGGYVGTSSSPARHDRDSYNEATHHVVDLLTGTTSGPS